MGFLKGAFDEELGLKPLAHQTPLHVHKAGQNRVDAPLSDIHLKRVECIARHFIRSLYCRDRAAV